MTSEQIITFTKVKLPYGWLSNMSRHSIVYKRHEYATAEALFQSLRFDDEAIRNQICEQTSPMTAKMVAKKHQEKMIIEPRGEQDVENMGLVLMLKIEQHPRLRQELLDTGDALIIENCSNRRSESGLFWGAALVDGTWVGQNVLGTIWMELREEIRRGEW